MSDHDLIRDLLARAAFAHDDDDARGVAACFALDGLMEVWERSDPSAITAVRGRDAIADATAVSLSRKSCPRRHALSTSLIDRPTLEDGVLVHRVRTYLHVWELPKARAARLVSTGTYHDQVVVVGGEALFRRRGIELDSSPFPETDPNAHLTKTIQQPK